LEPSTYSRNGAQTLMLRVCGYENMDPKTLSSIEPHPMKEKEEIRGSI